MKKIAVIGCGGSGKTYVSKKLGRRLNIPVHHLDKMFWRPGWEAINKPDFLDLQNEVCGRQVWILDGNYASTMTERFEYTDTVIFLDMPTVYCLRGVLRRYRRYRGAVRPDMTAGNTERLTWSFLAWILRFRSQKRPTILAQLARLRRSHNIHILKSRGEIESFFNTLVPPSKAIAITHT
jgi:adenylate kinase family enzyme